MSILGYTSGGSPIFSGPYKTKKVKSKPLYKCSADERHKLTKKQAEKSNYLCTHCGAELKVRKAKQEEYYKLMGIFND